MSEISGERSPAPLKRRSFFGYLVAGLAGGFLGGGLLRGLFARKVTPLRHRQSMKISANPLAVARTKESSKSHA
jgi:hypothetical protein